mgnify:CR=1 FL=1
MLNPRLNMLPEFAFARLARLLNSVRPAVVGPDLSIGDPKGDAPDWLAARIAEDAGAFRGYPPPAGTPELRGAIARWAQRRYGFLPDLDAIPEATLARTRLFYLCAPSNPQGRAASAAYWRRALELARAFDFVLVADECYSEIYHGAPPTGALEAAAATDGRFRNLVVFNSLSKRSNAAGLRVGFMAGDADVLARVLKVRRYGGATIPRPLQHAAVGLFDDEDHVAAIRRGYTERVDAALARLDGRFGAFRPDGGFFLWLDVGDGERAARTLYARAGVKTLPGRYLALADDTGRTPGDRYLRLALVHDLAATLTAVDALVTQLEPAA